jgi:hypothetical protein
VQNRNFLRDQGGYNTMKSTVLSRILALAAAAGMMAGLTVVGSAQPPSRPGIPGVGRPGGPGMQGGGRGRGGRQMGAAMLPVATLDAIVKLSPDQKTKVTGIHDGLEKSMTAMRSAPGQRPDFQKMMGQMTQANQAIDAVLTVPQKTKLAAAMKEIALYRMAGIPSGMYGQIKLTAAQKTSLLQIQQSVVGAGGPPDRNAMQAAREKAAAVLTPAQKQQVEDYQKAHPNERRGGGGRRAAGP